MGGDFADGELAWTSFERPSRCLPLDHFGAHTSIENQIHPTEKLWGFLC
jgi:hypothetical protein